MRHLDNLATYMVRQRASIDEDAAELINASVTCARTDFIAKGKFPFPFAHYFA